jgi:hypothetical protein
MFNNLKKSGCGSSNFKDKGFPPLASVQHFIHEEESSLCVKSTKIVIFDIYYHNVDTPKAQILHLFTIKVYSCPCVVLKEN